MQMERVDSAAAEVAADNADAVQVEQGRRHR